MTEFTKDIIGGLNLDSQLDTIDENQLIDAVNVSHHFDERSQGDLNPSLGLQHVGFVFRNNSSITTEEALKSWEEDQTSHSISAGDDALIVKYNKTTGNTYFFRIKKNKDYQFISNPSGYTNTIQYESICELKTETYCIDELWSSTWHMYQGVYTYFFTRTDAPLMIFTCGDTVQSLFAPYVLTASNSIFPPIKMIGFMSGPSIARPSMTKYTYRIQYVGNSFDAFVPPTEMIPICGASPRDYTCDETKTWGDKDSMAIKSHVRIKLQISFEEFEIVNARAVEVYAIRYIDDLDTPIVECIGIEAYSAVITIYDGVYNIPTDLTEFDLSSEWTSTSATYKTTAVKDDILYVANEQASASDEAYSSGFDPRVWQFNSSGKIILEDGTETDMDTVSSMPIQPRFFQNCGIEGNDFSVYQDTNRYSVFAQGGYYGASGKNVNIRFAVGAMDYGNVYPDSLSTSAEVTDVNMPLLGNPSYRFSKMFRGISPPSNTIGLAKEDIAGQWFSQDTTEGRPSHTDLRVYLAANDLASGVSQIKFALTPEEGGHSYDNPMFGSRFKCMQHDSVYRIGMVIYHKDGTKSDVLYMGDIRTPSMNTPEFPLFSNHVPVQQGIQADYQRKDGTTYKVAQHVELRFWPIFMRIQFNGLNDTKIKYIQIVYAKRENEDRNVVTVGAMHRTQNPVNTDPLTQDFYQYGQKSCLPPLPTLGKSRYYFGGMNTFCETDWSYTYASDDSNLGTGVRQLICDTMLAHNSPNTVTFVKGIVHAESHKSDEIFNVYLTSPVIINTNTKEQKSYLFYSPELDLADVEGKPLIHAISDMSSSIDSVCMHQCLSSIVVASSNRDMISCMHSDNNLTFHDFIKINAQFSNAYRTDNPFDFNTVNYDGLLQTFDIANEFNNGWDINPSIMTTNITHQLIAPTKHVKYRRREIITYTEKNDKVKTILTEQVVQEAAKEPHLMEVQNSLPPKNLKYFIPWNYYMRGSTRVNIQTTTLSISKKVYINNSEIISQKDIFQYLWPCSYCCPIPDANMADHPIKFVPITLDNTCFVNMSPLWSGDFHPTSTIDGTNGFLANAYMTLCSSQHRNAGHSVWWRNGHTNAKLPVGWNNLDASILPHTGHGQTVELDPTAIKDMFIKGQQIVPRFAANTPATFYPDTNQFEQKFLGILSDIPKEYELNFTHGEAPLAHELIFPDALWDEWVKKHAKATASFDNRGWSSYTVGNALKYTKGSAMAGKKLYNAIKKIYTRIDHSFQAGSVSFNYSIGLNSTGYGGNALLLTLKDDTLFPGDRDDFEVPSTANTFCDGKVTLQSDSSGFNKAEKVRSVLNYGSHVVLASLRNKMNPYSAKSLETTSWVDTSDECIIKPDTEWHTVYGFDTYVGAHKRMYMNAFYPDGFGVQGEGAYSASTPIRMMFPYEGMINIDAANLTDELDNKNNPGESSSLRRISKFGGAQWKRGLSGGIYESPKPDFSYNTVYSLSNPNMFYILDGSGIKTTEDLISKISYAQFNYSTGRFESFKPGNSLMLNTVYGGINVVVPHENELYIAQDRAVASVTINARTVLSTESDSRNLYIGSGTLFGDRYRYLTTVFGASGGARGFTSPNYVYWADIVHDAIIRASKTSIENIASSGKISSYIKALRTNAGTDVPVWSYRLRDGNIRFQFGYDPTGTLSLVPDIDRRILEYNEELGIFTSFNTLGDLDPVHISGNNIYTGFGFMFLEGTYNAWNFFKSLDIPPFIQCYINPTRDLHDKNFVSVVIPQYSDATLDMILEMDFDYGKSSSIKRLLQFFHYKKKKEYLIKDIDGKNKNELTSQIEPPSHSMPRIVYDQKKKTALLGRGVQFGRMLSMSLDKLQDFEVNGKDGAALLGKGFRLVVRFQTFNPQCRNEIGQPPYVNEEDHSQHLGRRKYYYFTPLHIQYTPNPKS